MIVPGVRFGVPFHLGSIAFPHSLQNSASPRRDISASIVGPPKKGGGIATQNASQSTLAPTQNVNLTASTTTGNQLGPAAAVVKNKSLYEWCCYIRPARPNQPCLSTIIEKVVFVLGKGFASPTREVRAPPFIINEIGWANAHIDIQVYFRTDEESLTDRIKNGGGVVASQIAGGTQLGGGISGSLMSPLPKGASTSNFESAIPESSDAVPGVAIESVANDTAKYGPFGKLVLHHEVKLHQHVPPQNTALLSAERFNKEKLQELYRLPEFGKAVVNEREDTFLFVSPPKALLDMWDRTNFQVAHHFATKGGEGKLTRKSKKSEEAVPAHLIPAWPPLEERLWNTLTEWHQNQAEGGGNRLAISVLQRVKQELLGEQKELKENVAALEVANATIKGEVSIALKKAQKAVGSKRKRGGEVEVSSDSDVEDGQQKKDEGEPEEAAQVSSLVDEDFVTL